MNLSDSPGEHPPRSPVPHYFPQLLQVHPRSNQYIFHSPLYRQSLHLLLLLLSPHANMISFSRPSALITCPKNIIFCLVALCNNDKPPRVFLSCSINSFLLLYVPATLSILLEIHISQASIFFSIAFVFVHVSQPHCEDYCLYNSRFCQISHVFILQYFYYTVVCVATLPSVTLGRITSSHPPMCYP